MERINLVAGRLFCITGRFLAKVIAKGISMINEPHPVPRGALLRSWRPQRRSRRMPYLSIFDIH
jgi:hypothetical protein